MKRKPGFDLGKHKQVGADLKAMINRLTTLDREISNAYHKNSIVSRRANRALKGIRLLRSRLDDLVCLENPSYWEVTLVYYGPVEDEEQP